MVRRFLALPAAILIALAFAGAAAANAGLAPVTPESPNANAIRQTYFVILAVTGVIFLLVEGALILFVVRFRGRGRARAGRTAHRSTARRSSRPPRRSFRS